MIIPTRSLVYLFCQLLLLLEATTTELTPFATSSIIIGLIPTSFIAIFIIVSLTIMTIEEETNKCQVPNHHQLTHAFSCMQCCDNVCQTSQHTKPLWKRTRMGWQIPCKAAQTQTQTKMQTRQTASSLVLRVGYPGGTVVWGYNYDWHVNSHLIERFKWCAYHFEDEIHAVLLIQKTWKLLKVMANYNRIEFVYENLVSRNTCIPIETNIFCARILNDSFCCCCNCLLLCTTVVTTMKHFVRLLIVSERLIWNQLVFGVPTMCHMS